MLMFIQDTSKIRRCKLHRKTLIVIFFVVISFNIFSQEVIEESKQEETSQTVAKEKDIVKKESKTYPSTFQTDLSLMAYTLGDLLLTYLKLLKYLYFSLIIL